MFKNKNRFQIGFTLLELLIVIAIIGVLVSIGTVSYSQAQKKSRDAKRQGDLKATQNAFEQYSSVNGRYPQNSTEAANAMQTGALPADPRSTGSWFYTFGYDTTAPVGETYCLCAYLEFAGTGNASAPASGPTCSYGGTKNYFCVSNLQ